MPFDNLHAGWCMGVESESFASAGCQVLVGFPKCSKRGTKPETGPWKAGAKTQRADPIASGGEDLEVLMAFSSQRPDDPCQRPAQCRPAGCLR